MPTAARFTPSLLDEATLEFLFVGRHHFVDDCVARVRKAATGTARSAKLFVGPRGAGKTHLLSLVNYRCRHLEEFGKTFQVAWLPEDLWTIDSLASLLKEIVRAIEPSLPNADIGLTEKPIETLRRAVSLCGPVVVLIENIDQVFEAMGESGQRELRALIENTGNLLLIATSTRSNESLTNQASPFYGFFDTTELEQFSVDDAAVMLKRIADQNSNTELSAFLDTPRARQRLAAISHLAGGQPRVWSLLASGLTVEGLDDLVGVLMERFDDLTPYYQEQMARLSLNERKTVRALADLDHSCTVKDLAAETGIDQRSISKTISDLRQKGWVRQRTGPIVNMADGRHSYYDLAEPLARLAFQLKESRGKPIRLIVDFLTLWFDEQTFANSSQSPESLRYIAEVKFENLVGRFVTLFSETPFRIDFVPPVIANANRVLELSSGLDSALADLSAGDASRLLGLPSGLVGLMDEQIRSGASIELLRLRLAYMAVDFNQPVGWIRKVESLAVENLSLDGRISAHGVLSQLYAQNGQLDLARVETDSFCELATPRAKVVLAFGHLQWSSPLIALHITKEEFGDAVDSLYRCLRLIVRGGCFNLLNDRAQLAQTHSELEKLVRSRVEGESDTESAEPELLRRSFSAWSKSYVRFLNSYS